VGFCDAVQSFLATPWTVSDLRADLVSVSAHKVHGPQGVGGLYVRAGTKVVPLAVGGGQEREMRAGTEPVAGIVGFAAAIRALPRCFESSARSAFLAGVSCGVPTVGSAADCLPGLAHVRVPGVDAEVMLASLDRGGVSASSGSACSSGSLEPSHVLLACGYSRAEAREGLRFSFSRFSSVEDAGFAASVLNAEAQRILGARGARVQ